MYLWLASVITKFRCDEEGQGVSEYAMILVLIVLIVVSVVHAIGSNAQQVIDKVNTALHIG
jgi:Flp pilus assembly pilin Flp